MPWSNFHTHTLYCDGRDVPENFIREAIRQKMLALGFSSHAPVPFENEWSIRTEFDLQAYCKEINGLKTHYSPEIEIYKALELDYIPGIAENFNGFKNELSLDYTIGSVHLVTNPGEKTLWFIDGPVSNFDIGLENVFQNDIRKGVECYYRQSIEMIETQKPDIIGHPDKIKMNNQGRYFDEHETWYKNLLLELLETARKYNTIVEINTRGIYKKRYNGLYPDNWAIRYCVDNRIPLMLNADAHKPSELTGFFSETALILKEIGVKELVIRKNNEWQSVGFDERGYLV